ncbi:DUF3862 domain-containing protein [Clostridium sp. SM-530-WT-3G]|uniref:DUF3862 domain-containing protein n=1 Tax=Clostridium sp. SM-530-WT-3G TaxID=2725303 RepID=UPI00145EF744|nr:DUF3862 domain-containing protein [Clostridium sp. SM-530-WT-3G]NME81650.1 DUF3862 domain-containing protein [Clostridium sp. SM-530-WT-3G]
MTEDKQTYKRVLLIFVAILSIYGAYSSGNKYNDYFYNKESLKQLNSSECVTADNLSFDNSDSDIKNIDNIDSRISYDNFLKLKMGMSYDEVKNILGDGKEIPPSEAHGKKTTIYEYNGEGISNITITLQDDCVISKTQLNLKHSDGKELSLNDYNKINSGMSYDKVKDLIGDGELTTESSVANSIIDVYSYINKDGSSANFTFDNGSLRMKSQYSLK